LLKNAIDMMSVLIDGKQVECETIEFVNEDLIIGCSGAGGVHTEFYGSSRIAIDGMDLTAEIVANDGEVQNECIINLDDLLNEMGSTSIRMKHADDDFDDFIELQDLFL